MTDHRWNSDLEADNSVDWSLMNSRLDSFRGSSLAQHVSAERLARAGFYFTGHADQVRCFSCQKTVENWRGGDVPVERHIEVSPSCMFLSCVHRPRYSSGPNASVRNGSYNEAAEDMEFHLRRGEVVDESPYPMVPHMANEDARLQTFNGWRSAAVRPRDLAQAGLFYSGTGDRAQCFCCGGILAGWEVGDTAWGEHAKHFPNCFFILGHDVGNIPSQGRPLIEDGGNRQPSLALPGMSSFEQRLNSFTGVLLPIDHARLATAGFYSAGAGDRVLCFHCGGGLKGWQPQEDPWEEHAKHYPGCGFLLTEKGQEFINRVQLQDPRQTSSKNGFATHQNDVLQSSMAQKAIGMGLDPTTVERAILERIRRTGSSYSSLEELLEDCLKKSPDTSNVNSEEQDEDPLEKLRKLEMEKQCKVCMDRDICIVFIPCGHLATCKECSQSLTKCPICCGAISQKIKAYIS